MATPHTVMHSEQMPVHLTFFMFPVVSKWGKAAYNKFSSNFGEMNYSY